MPFSVWGAGNQGQSHWSQGNNPNPLSKIFPHHASSSRYPTEQSPQSFNKGRGRGGNSIEEMEGELIERVDSLHALLLDLNVPQRRAVQAWTQVEAMRAQVLQAYGVSTDGSRPGGGGGREWGQGRDWGYGKGGGKSGQGPKGGEQPNAGKPRLQKDVPLTPPGGGTQGENKKTQLNNVAQCLAQHLHGKGITKDDLIYEATEVEDGMYQGTVVFKLYDPDTTYFAEELADSKKGAEMLAAKVAVDALMPVAEPLMKEGKKRKAKDGKKEGAKRPRKEGEDEDAEPEAVALIDSLAEELAADAEN